MTRLVIALCAVGICVAGLFAVNSQAEETKKVTVKQVMAKAMKGGLCKKVASGEAGEAEKAELLKMFQAMAAAKPKKGDEASWKAKTTALVSAAQAAVDGKANASALLGEAMNCKACHSVHK